MKVCWHLRFHVCGGIHHQAVTTVCKIGGSGEVTCRTMAKIVRSCNRSGIGSATAKDRVPVARALRGSLLGRPPDSDLLMVRVPVPGKMPRSPLAVLRMKLVTALGP